MQETEIMQRKGNPAYGISLITGSLLLTITMLLHPVGGSFEHLIRITPVIIWTHSIAIASIPLLIYGYWGFMRCLQTDSPVSTLAFITICIGMFSGICAAAVNGLALPLFINNFNDATPEIIQSLKPILTFSNSLNHAFDFIFIGALCISTFLWSIEIFKTGNLSRWIAYSGMALCLVLIASLFQGLAIVHLSGFRLLIFGFVCWTIAIAISIFKKNIKVTHDKTFIQS